MRKESDNRKMSKRAQMTIFVIIAIVVVAGILLFLIVKQSPNGVIPRDMAQVYDYYGSCIKEKAREAIEVAGTQGGYVDVPAYIPGSEYAPSSNQLNFLGNPVPYWFYVSGNGIVREQVPTKQLIEKQIARYIEDNLDNCDYSQFYSQGFGISFGDPSVSVSLSDSKLSIITKANVIVSKGEEISTKSTHEVELDSKFGKLYNDALTIYDKEKSEAFLENYSVDVLRLYAPVDGVESTCGAKVWNTQEVISGLKSGLEANVAAIRYGSGRNKYFVVSDNTIGDGVNFIYSQNWSTKISIYGSKVDSALMIAEPVAGQTSLGAMGFCYIPYHFVYDLSYPVLVQVSSGDEIFQFPVVVVIDKNVPRVGENSSFASENNDFDLCAFKTQDLTINLYNVDLNKVDGDISYQCLNQECYLGKTKEGTFVGMAPACVNGYLNVNAHGYAEKSQLFSTNEESNADIILDREYPINIALQLGGNLYNGNALVTFENSDNGKIISAFLPGNNVINLTEGSYSIKATAFGNSSITLPGSTNRQCTDVPKSGVLGFFGGMETKCYDVTMPETKLDNVLVGGGSTQTYLLTSDLEKGKITLIGDKATIPGSIVDLQNSFASFDSERVELRFG